MANKQICSINLDASRGSNVTLGCKLSEWSNGCSWKRRDNAISISGRYSYLDNSGKEPRHDCSIAIREIKDIDKGKWICEEMAGDRSVTSDGKNKIQQCEMTSQNKQDQTSSHIPNIPGGTPQHYSSATPTLDSQLTATEMTTNWNNSQVINVSPNAKAVLYSFTGLFGALGLVVLITCLIFIIHFIYDRLQRHTTDNRSNESQMEMNECGQRRIGDNLGGYAPSENFIMDSIDQLYDDTVEKPIKNIKKKNGRVRSGSREWLPGNQHQNLDHRNHSKQRKYLKLIFGSVLPSSRANSNVTMSSKSSNIPKVVPDIINRHLPNVTDTRSSFASEEALNHHYHYIGVGITNPPAITIASPSTAQTLLSNPTDRSPDTRLAAKHNVSFSVNTNTRKEMAPLPQALQHSVSTTQLPKYMTSSFTPGTPTPKPQLRLTVKANNRLNRTNPTLPTFQEMIPKRISTLAVNENPTFPPPLPPPLPKYEPAETGEPITNSNEDPSYEEVWLESPKITNNEVEGCSANSETSKKDVGDHETTIEFSNLYENYVDLVKDSSPSKDGNGAHNLFSPRSTQEKVTSKMMNPVKKKKPRPLERTSNKTSKNNC